MHKNATKIMQKETIGSLATLIIAPYIVIVIVLLHILAPLLAASLSQYLFPWS